MTARIAVWWRDDDAVEDTPALRRLIDLKRKWALPLALAVIPKRARGSLSVLAEEPDIDVLVHGYAHADHAAPGERKAEFTPDRDIAIMRREWRDGQAGLKRILPETLPVFVPPWNRFPKELIDQLALAGYQGLSAWGPEAEWRKESGLTVANMHLDVIDWRNGGVAKSLDELTAGLMALAASGRHSLTAPIGVLTHHLQMPDAAFANLDGLFRVVAQMPDFVWTGARSIFRRPE